MKKPMAEGILMESRYLIQHFYAGLLACRTSQDQQTTPFFHFVVLFSHKLTDDTRKVKQARSCLILPCIFVLVADQHKYWKEGLAPWD